MKPKCFGKYKMGICEDIVNLGACKTSLLKKCRKETIKKGKN